MREGGGVEEIGQGVRCGFNMCDSLLLLLLLFILYISNL